MSKALNMAYYLAKKLPYVENSYNGSLKMQKLLFFADMIHLFENSKPLFDDKVLAFQSLRGNMFAAFERELYSELLNKTFDSGETTLQSRIGGLDFAWL